jgi:hypothetical protein
MANVLTEVIPQLLAQGLLALRENSIMPRLVNSDYSELAAQKGATIDVPIPSAVAAVDVTPSATAPDPGDLGPTSAAITLDNWVEAAFQLSDKDIAEVMLGTIPMQASEAIKSLANRVDNDILSLYDTIYGYAGTPGTTPFGSDTSEATESRKVLNKQLAPLPDRRFVLDPDAEAEALNLRAFQDMSFSGSNAVITEGQINRKLGFDWFMDQNMPTHTNGGQNGAYLVNGVTAVGATSITLKTGVGTVLKGDTFTIAGDTQTYICTADSVGGAVAIGISPPLKIATAGDEAITFKGTASTTYAQNLAFHRDAFAFATRPLADTEGLGHFQSAMDPVSGLTLRLEVSRENRRTRYAFDILYGFATIRAELACRLWGDDQ